MYTLLLDTHFSTVTIVLYKDGKVVAIEEKESNQSHSIITMPLLESLLTNNGINIKDISEIVVVNGPGSFTGVRIGVTIAKTISYCLNIPIKVISSLEVLASNVITDNNKIVALNDRNGYFIGKFTSDNKLEEDYYYISNAEYKEFAKDNKIYDFFEYIDYEKVYETLKSKDNLNPHLVNPLYVKKIEVQKWFGMLN